MAHYPNSYYINSLERDLIHHPSLNDSYECDLCIIGGGFTGLSTAIEASQKGLKVILLEQNRIAWGASGRNGGQLLHDFSGNFSSQKHSNDEQKQLWNFTIDAVREVKKNIKDLNIDCGLIEGYLQAAVTRSHDEELKKYVDLLNKKFEY